MKILKLFFVFCVICMAFKQQDKIRIFSIGDSTMCDYDQHYLSQFGGEGYPIRGWMQMMSDFFTDKVEIHNMARSGRSSKSFRQEGFWKKVIEQVHAGDYVFIMFGPNDQKNDTARHTDPATTFKQYMTEYIEETREKGAIPVLFTSIVRRKFNPDGTLRYDSLSNYVAEVRKLSVQLHVPMIDLNAKTKILVERYGPEKSKELYLYIEPGKFVKLPKGKKDDTHLCVLGATKVAQAAAEGIKELNLPLARYLK